MPVRQGRPSRRGEFHPGPLTDPDLTLSRHPAQPPHEGCRLPFNIGSLPLPVDPISKAMACRLRSTGIATAISTFLTFPPGKTCCKSFCLSQSRRHARPDGSQPLSTNLIKRHSISTKSIKAKMRIAVQCRLAAVACRLATRSLDPCTASRWW
jgi:hypothetical protein